MKSASSRTVTGLSLAWLFPMGLEKHGRETKIERMEAGISSWSKWLFFLCLKIFQILIMDG